MEVYICTGKSTSVPGGPHPFGAEVHHRVRRSTIGAEVHIVQESVSPDRECSVKHDKTGRSRKCDLPFTRRKCGPAGITSARWTSLQPDVDLRYSQKWPSGYRCDQGTVR